MRDLDRADGIDYTMKDGVLFDAETLLPDMTQIVNRIKQEAGPIPDAELELTQQRDWLGRGTMPRRNESGRN